MYVQSKVYYIARVITIAPLNLHNLLHANVKRKR